MSERVDRDALLAALEMQFEAGVDESTGDVPLDRLLAAETERSESERRGAAAARKPRSANVAPARTGTFLADHPASAPEVARAMAARCADLEALRTAMGVFEFCALKKGARNLVFADGNPAARLMIVGEAPGRDEDRQGLPFVGRAGRLLDEMFRAIDMRRDSPDRETALYITNVLPWRPPNNRDPTAEEIAMMKPFLVRHVELAGPDVIVLMGNSALRAVLARTGITRLRGSWLEGLGRPVMPMFHPAALLRDGLKKRDAWSDLLEIRRRLDR